MTDDVMEKRREYMREYMRNWRSDPRNRRRQRVINRNSYHRKKLREQQERRNGYADYDDE